MYFETIADLRAQPFVPPDTEFIVGGYFAPGDGGGGTFIWIPQPSPYVIDRGIIFNKTNNTSQYQCDEHCTKPYLCRQCHAFTTTRILCAYAETLVIMTLANLTHKVANVQ